MRHGIVVGLQARMRVVLHSIEGSEIEIECVVDTGFEGFLTIAMSFNISNSHSLRLCVSA